MIPDYNSLQNSNSLNEIPSNDTNKTDYIDALNEILNENVEVNKTQIFSKDIEEIDDYIKFLNEYVNEKDEHSVDADIIKPLHRDNKVEPNVTNIIDNKYLLTENEFWGKISRLLNGPLY